MRPSAGTSGDATWAQIGAVFTAIGASLCCVAPLVLISIGVSGAWMSSLTALEPYRPLFVIATATLLGIAGWRLYRRDQACTPDEVCANPAVKRRQRVIFWFVAISALALLSFPWYASAIL